MAQVINTDVYDFLKIKDILKKQGLDLEQFADINILGQAPIAATALLAGISSKYIQNDSFGNPYFIADNMGDKSRISLAAVYYFIDDKNQIWIKSFVRKNDELQNDTGLKKYDLHLAAKGFGLSSAPFKLSYEDSKLNIVNQFIGTYVAYEQTDGVDDFEHIYMPIVCFHVKTKPKDAIKIEDVDERKSTSKMIAAKKSILYDNIP